MAQTKTKAQLHEYLLPLTVFITGACVLVLEIVAVRVLSPYYGNTIYTVSSVISVILAALSLGYYIGGRLSDLRPSNFLFFAIITASGWVVLLFHLLGVLILPTLSSNLTLASGPFLSSLLLFLFPAFLLGMLSPYAIKLQSVSFPNQGVGSIAGKMFFWSTIGSITGSLLAGFVLIPMMGINAIFISIAIVLFFTGFLPLLYFKLGVTRAILALAVFMATTVFVNGYVESRRTDVVYFRDGLYEGLTVADGVYRQRPTRFFMQDRSFSGASHLDTDDPTDLAFDYVKYYALYQAIDKKIDKALVIGGGIYSVPGALISEYDDVVVDVAEIEPGLEELAIEHFSLEKSPRIRTYVEDGRRLLSDSEEKYDLIFSDAYHSLYSIPAHLTTVEFFKLAKQRMSEDGVFVANLIGSVKQTSPSFLLSQAKTFQQVFPNNYFFATESPDNEGLQNIMMVGINGETKIDFESELVRSSGTKIVRELSDKKLDFAEGYLDSHKIFTDDFAPVDYYAGRALN
jgi:spermidine synthase